MRQIKSGEGPKELLDLLRLDSEAMALEHTAGNTPTTWCCWGGDGGRMTRHMVTPALHRFARAAGLRAVRPP
jgi:hypothetical protein